MPIKLEFKLQDMWIGAYWETKEHPSKGQDPVLRGCYKRVDIWICLLPTVPVHIWFYRYQKGYEDYMSEIL
jgi:hypothetical protein